MVASITFWGAVYGGVFALVVPSVRGPLWLKGMIAALCAMTLSWFVFLPLMGQSAAFGWHAWPMLRSFVAYQMWGLGLGLLLPLVTPRHWGGSSGRWGGHHLAA
jgi:hypothetical protein